MYIKRYRTASFLLAILVLIFGTRYEKSRLEALSVYAPAERENPVIRMTDDMIRDIQLCTSKMLGVRSHTDIQQLSNRHTGLGRDVKISLQFLCLKPFSSDEGNFYTGSPAVLYYHPYQEELIPKYLHESDGKKRI